MLCPSARFCDALCLGFAAWTLAAHICVGLGGHLFHLLGLFALALALICTFAWCNRACGTSLPQPSEDGARTQDPAASQRGLRVLAVAIAALGALVLGAANATWLWVAGAFALSLGLFCARRDAPLDALVPTRRAEGLVWTLALLCAALALATHRPDHDDSFYLNVAVHVADQPFRALLSGDTIHGVPGLPLHNPAHQVHSLEILYGALSYATGLPAIAVSHWLAASLAAFCVPLAHVRLFRELLPRNWPWALGAALFAMLLLGDAHRSHGNFGLVRIWQGKAMLVSVGLPLVYAYVLSFAREPSAGRWLLVAASQIGAVGLSSSAIWAAPLAAAVALLSAVALDRSGLRRTMLGLAACAYPLVVGALLRGQLSGVSRAVRADVAQLAEAGLGPFDRTLERVFGDGASLEVVALCAFAAWTLAPAGALRRFLVALPLVGWMLMSPLWDDFVSLQVTGSHWRTSWALPAPILIGLALGALFEHPRLRGNQRRTAVTALVVLALSALPIRSTLSAENIGSLGIRFGIPGYKVDTPAYRQAQTLTDLVGPHTTLLAPPRIAAWVPTFVGHPSLVLARPHYLAALTQRHGERAAQARRRLSHITSGAAVSPADVSLFRSALEEPGIGAVCIAEGPAEAGLLGALRENGFARRENTGGCTLWQRNGRAHPAL